MHPDIRILSLASILGLIILAFVLATSCAQGEEVQRFDAQICFPERSDILVSTSNVIPNMTIVETKTFVMVSQGGNDQPCQSAVAFMEEVKHHGGNAVIGFSSMVITGPDPRQQVAFHGTAVVVEPVEN